MPTSTIVVIGGLTRRYIANVDVIPKSGQTVTAESHNTHTGGRAAFTAVTAYRQAHYEKTSDRPATCVLDDGEIKVHLVSAYGDDDLGPPLKERISEAGVNTDSVRVVPGTKTSVSFVIVDDDTKEHRVIYCPGAIHKISSELFSNESKLIKECGGKKPDLIVLNCELEQVTVEKVLSTAKSAGIAVLLNFVPEIHIFKKHFKDLKHLILHRAEAREIHSKPSLGADGHAVWGEVVQEWIDHGVENVVLTLGPNGAYCANKRTGARKHIPGSEGTSSINRVGVGETFVGTYAVEYIKSLRANSQNGWDIGKAVRRSCRAASLNLNHDGCIDLIQWANHVDDLNESGE